MSISIGANQTIIPRYTLLIKGYKIINQFTYFVKTVKFYIMKFYYKVLLDFVGLPWQFLVPFGSRISILFFANELFSGCAITKVEFDTAVKDLQTKGVLNIHGDELTKVARDAAYDLLMGLMRQLADYTNFVAKGDMAIILQSGFNSTSPTTHGGKGGLEAVNGEISGDVILSWGKIPNARSYIVRYCLNEDGQRDTFVTEGGKGTTGAVLHGLVKGKEYMFYMCAVYSDHQGAFCNPVFLVIM